jgi:hypothetical protein
MDHPLRAPEKPAAPGGQSNGRVTTTLVGSAAVNPNTQRVLSFQIVSETAEYLWHWQGKPIRSKFILACELEP